MQKETSHIKLKTVFMGTSHFAEGTLKALIENEYNIVAIFTKPDAKIGRKQEVAESPIKKLALEKNIPVFQPQKFDNEIINKLKSLKPDLIIVTAYGKILPKEVLDIPGFGCVNVHPSLLPKFRGPSPIQNTLLTGEKETGTTIMLMDEKMDTGDILAQEKILIEDSDNAQILSEKLLILSCDLLVKTLPLWIGRKIEPIKQDDSQATLCQLIEREDGRIIWEQDAQEIYNKFRALFPWPGIFTFWKNDAMLTRIKLLKIKLQKINPEIHHKVGEVFEIGDSIGIQALNGVIIIEELQMEGKNPASAKEFINGYRNFVGSILI
ncbi:MAG: hypothetical protein ACD_11C00020G0019 [uncultured bacterium]|nr:MAG: hypothetical protein ACD_11C00020G0019 [uncultured bacterium]HBR71304.1 methionyl-tRNA formyltransferase [Candidatus Moranbacteria bacterium]